MSQCRSESREQTVEDAGPYMQRKKTVVVTKPPPLSAREILGRIVVLRPEGVVTYDERKETAIVTKSISRKLVVKIVLPYTK